MPKKGNRSVGGTPQYATTLGKTANCQTLVSLTLARGEVRFPAVKSLTDPAKIDTLTAVLTLAMIWIYKAATDSLGMKAIAGKAHGRRQKSWFCTGCDAPDTAAALWTETCPKRLRSP